MALGLWDLNGAGVTHVLPQGLCTWVTLSFLCFQLKEKSQACGGNLGSIEELRGAIYLAEEACPGISDTMVAQLVQRLQR